MNLVDTDHFLADWPLVDPGWPLHDLWLQHCTTLWSGFLLIKFDSQNAFLEWPLVDPGWPQHDLLLQPCTTLGSEILLSISGTFIIEIVKLSIHFIFGCHLHGSVFWRSLTLSSLYLTLAFLNFTLKSISTFTLFDRICLCKSSYPGGGGSFIKIVRGCACRTSKIWLSLYQFFAKFPTHQYTIFERKAPNFDQIGCFLQ